VTNRTRFPILPLALVAALAAASPARGQARFDVMETTIARIHEAMSAGRLTSRQLAQMYLDRIAAYDDRGPSLNAISRVHPRALEIADSLDRIFAQTGRFVGPLHGIPVIVKDNYDTFDLPTTAGSRALLNSVPPDDAFMVGKVRAAGGIVIAKSAMAEWAFSPYETIGSAQPGYTFNPYALNRVPAGSSGGTGAAVAANLGAVGLGTDTGNSIRGPSSHNALVGIRPSRGLTSRDGIIPLFLERDVGGPMTRTVEDAARMLDVLAGADPADSVTAASAGHIAETYTSFLDAGALRGARLGVVRSLSNRRGHDPEVLQRFEEAIAELRRLGATVIDSVSVGVLDSVRVSLCSSFRLDVEAYFASLGPAAPVRSLQTVVDSGWYNVTVGDRLEGRLDSGNAGDPARCAEAAASVARFRAGLRHEFESRRLDALIYPTWANPPRLIGDLDSPHGDNSQSLAPPSGFPAITVPMGWVRDGGLPVGLQLLGVMWDEGRLIRLAYAWEQATKHRRPPASAPPLEGGR
jgi:Asp-tRNA(Asn)/Glu-tRNA(Gln) amidotransferase A subunit family amidase